MECEPVGENTNFEMLSSKVFAVSTSFCFSFSFDFLFFSILCFLLFTPIQMEMVIRKPKNIPRKSPLEVIWVDKYTLTKPMLTYEVVSLFQVLLPRWASPPVTASTPDGQTRSIGFPCLSWQLWPDPMVLPAVVDSNYEQEKRLVGEEQQEEGGNGAGDLVLVASHRVSKGVPSSQRPHLDWPLESLPQCSLRQSCSLSGRQTHFISAELQSYFECQMSVKLTHSKTVHLIQEFHFLRTKNTFST